MTHPLEPLVTAAYADRTLLAKPATREAVLAAIAGLDDGTLRIAEKGPEGWTVQVWLKEACAGWRPSRSARSSSTTSCR